MQEFTEKRNCAKTHWITRKEFHGKTAMYISNVWSIDFGTCIIKILYTSWNTTLNLGTRYLLKFQNCNTIRLTFYCGEEWIIITHNYVEHKNQTLSDAGFKSLFQIKQFCSSFFQPWDCTYSAYMYSFIHSYLYDWPSHDSGEHRVKSYTTVI